MKHTILSAALGALLLESVVAEAAIFDALEYRNVGPSRGGRVTAVAGTVLEPGTFYLGASGGGVWKSTDYGTSWNNVSDGFFPTPSIGDISVSQSDPNVVYVGTGSDGLRSNVIAGKGMYKSIDGGENWTSIGLESAGQIGAVEIDPRSNNVVWVAAIGQAFNASPERGVYKTMDGGQSWSKVLGVSDTVGFSDLEMMPHNPDVVLATAWRAERKPWTIISGGTQEEGGIYKTVDGGKNWRKVTEGLPSGLIGKIDLAVSPADSRIVYALVEAPGDEGGMYKSVDQGESFVQVSSERGLVNRPFYYANVEADPVNPDVLYVMATRYHKSVDGGKNWEQMTPPHGDSHDMWINPDNPQLFIQANDGGANVTHNGGETWSSQFNQPTTELYQVEVDDQYPYWLYAGQQDNGSTISVPARAPFRVQSRDAWFLETGGCETGPAVPKPGDHNTVYANCKGRFGVFDKRTGTERSYYVGAANMYGQNPRDLRYRFQRVSPVHVSPHDPDMVFHASQYVHRTTDDGVTWETISPDLTANEPDKQVISGEPITRDITGEEFYSTIYSLRESPLKAGLIWVGANDGPVHVTQNGGESWEKVTPRGLPKGGRVDSVEPSAHDPAVAYVAVLRYQLGDPKPYVYRTGDYGKSWTLLTDGNNGIPSDYPVRVVREDPERQGLLYAGTEYGIFVSFDDGGSWESFQQNLPVTPVTDIKIHRGDLVLSTMGRAFWVLDKVATLRQVSMSALGDAPVLFTPDGTIRYRQTFRNPDPEAVPQYPTPAAMLDYYLPEGFEDGLTLEVLDADGQLVNAFTVAEDDDGAETEVVEDMMLNEVRFLETDTLTSHAGLNRFAWDMRYRGAWHKDEEKRFQRGPLAPPGQYRVRLSAGGGVQEQTFEILADPRVPELGVSADDIQAQITLARQVQSLLDEARRMAQSLHEEMDALAEGDSERRDGIKTALAALETEKGTYMPSMLIDQIVYLSYMLDQADQAPGKEALDRYDVLQKEYREIAAAIGS